MRAKEAVEQENVEIKRRLAGIVGMLQPLIGSGKSIYRETKPTRLTASLAAVEAAYVSPAQTQAPAPSQNPPAALSVQNASTPTSTASPGSLDHSAGQMWPGGGDQAKMQLTQQRHELRHGLELGPERLGLDFLLDPHQRVAKIQAGVNGAQDTPQYQHISMKHDWTVTPKDQAFRVRPDPGPWFSSPARIEAPSMPSPDQTEGLAGYSAPVKNCKPTCPLDSLLLDFLSERRQRAAEGLSPQEVVGPRYPSVSSLLNPANSAYSHPLSKVFTDILSTFPDLSSLPERVAVLYIMFLVMRWQISPTQENYDRLPEWMTPRPSQLFTAHPAWIDHIPFPLMREKIVRMYNPTEYLFDNFFIPFTTTLNVSWPYEETDTLLRSPDSDELLINPVFERHLRNLDNWKLGEAFVKAFPSLADTGNFECRVPAPIL